MVKIHWRELGIVAGLVLGVGEGCGTTINEIPLNSPGRSMTPRDPDAVEVFASHPPSRPYTEVAILEAQQASAYSTAQPADVMAKLRAYAARKGCEAIIMNGPNDSTVGSGSVTKGNGSSYVTTLKGYRFTCIVYTGSDGSPPMPSPSSEAAPSAKSDVRAASEKPK